MSSARPTPTEPPAAESATVRPGLADQEEAHRLVIAATACWLGGVWSDATGISDAGARAAAAQRRCHDFMLKAYGADDKLRYERVRAAEAAEVSELKQKILAVARRDAVDPARQDDLVKLLEGIADAERETMYARRAGDRVKKDIEAGREGKRTEDEQAAVAPLSESQAFNALLKLDARDLTPEARTVAILYATDRMEIARGLPKHLKVYLVEGPYLALFGVPPPEVPKEGWKSMKGGEWLSYISTVANAAGHPVPEQARSLTDQELLAWGGALKGLSDKLRAEALEVSDATELKHVTMAVVNRLDNEYRLSEEHVMREAEPAMPPKPYGPPP